MDELNRDILIGHLYDVRALEIAKLKLLEILNRNNTKIKQLGYPQHYKKPSYALTIIIPLLVAAFLSFVSCIMSQTIFRGDLYDRQLDPKYEFMIAPNSDIYYDYIPSQPEFNEYVSTSATIILIIAITVFVSLFIIALGDNKRYNELVKQDYERVSKEKQEIVRLKDEINQATTKLKEVNTLLSEAYSINIIPQQYRTVQGVCYLYDYMSTSQQTLDSAFLNCNVNQINVGINKMIEQQSEMILQQYVTNAKLDIMKNHSKKMVEQLANIEQNTAASAQYSAITAAHAKANTFFEGYKFFKDK